MVHAEHINVSINFSRLFDINDDLLDCGPAGESKVVQKHKQKYGLSCCWLLTHAITLCDYMHFEDITKLFLPGWILWPLLSTEKVPKCVTVLQLNNNRPTDPMCSKFLACVWQINVNSLGRAEVIRKSCFSSQTFAEQYESLNDIISLQSWVDWWWKFGK